MSARPLATATISFGLVSIPVRLYSSTESSENISFRMLHEECKTPVKYQYWCPQDQKAVERGDIIKGYEFAKGQFVIFTADELKALEEEATKAIAIEEFVPLDLIDPVYYDRAYYLRADKGGNRAYHLLSRAMTMKGIGGLAKYAARGKQYLVLVRPVPDGLIMQQLRYNNEVRSFSDIPDEGSGDVKDAELQLALQLIEQTMSDDFSPDKYEDDVRARLTEVIEQKVDGQEIAFAPAESPAAQVIDLMEALKASLGDESGDALDTKAAPQKATGKSMARKRASG